MAKATKKSSKKPTKTTPTKTEVRRTAPSSNEEPLVWFGMPKDDLAAFANLMTVCAKTFERLALQAAAESDEATFTVLQARHRLCAMYAEKLIDSVRMPEPVSRDFH